MTILNFLKKDLYIIRLSSLLLLTFIIYTRSYPGSDHLNQLGSAFNFIKGNGFSLGFFDGKEIYYNNLDRWPKFYSIVLALWLFITKNVNLSFLFGEFSFYSLFVFSLYQIISLLFKESVNKNLAINLTAISLATSIAPFKYGTGMDVACVSVFLISSVYLYKYYFESLNYKHIVVVFCGLSFICHMRYDYLPKALMFYVFIIAIDIFQKNTKKHFFLKILLSFVFFVNFTNIYLSDYFQKSSSSIADVTTIQTVNFDSYWNVLYAPFINSFFPDFIMYTFLGKFLTSTLSHNYFLFVLILSGSSLIILLALLKNYDIKLILKNIKKNFTPLTLLFFCISNLATLFVVYGPFEFYNFSWIESPYTMAYSGLAIVNRYFLLLHVSTFLLGIYYGLAHKNTFFRYLIFCSILFGLIHFCYLFSKYSLKKEENRKLVSNTSEVYIDCQKINTILNLDNDNNNLLVPLYQNDTIYNRQVTPKQIARSNGFVIYRTKDSFDSTLEFNTKFDNVYICSSTRRKETFKSYETIYKGEIYSLHKK